MLEINEALILKTRESSVGELKDLRLRKDIMKYV